MSRPDIAVVGAGVIGLAVAWRCAQRGLAVRILDPAPGGGASPVAAGMLAPVSEAQFGEEALTGLQLESQRRWPAFAAEVAAAAGGMDVGYRTGGTLMVALTDDDLSIVERMRGYQERLGLAVQRLSGAAVRDREPALHPRIRGGAHAPGDHQVDPRRLLAALAEAVRLGGVETEPTTVVDVSTVDASVVVVAAGCGSAALRGLPAPLPVRPVKGELLRLRSPAAAAVLGHTIRGYADGRPVYLVPRTDGELVVGATVEERRDATVSAGAVLELLRAAADLVPGIVEYELAEACVGHRPGTPDNGPLLGELGRAAGRRVVAATGHYRNGILLAPITADTVAELVATGVTPAAIEPFRPDRAAVSGQQVSAWT